MVGDVSVYEDISRFEPEYGFGRDSGVCAPNEQVFRALRVGMLAEIVRVVGDFFLGPGSVVLKDPFEVLHCLKGKSLVKEIIILGSLLYWDL